MFDESADVVPEPQPDGSLVPPPAHPPTAVAAAAPLMPQEPVSATIHDATLLQLVGQAIERALDLADDVADNIARATGLDPSRG